MHKTYCKLTNLFIFKFIGISNYQQNPYFFGNGASAEQYSYGSYSTGAGQCCGDTLGNGIGYGYLEGCIFGDGSMGREELTFDEMGLMDA